ncbi:hypothetical protein SHIRM173S_02964 [Streptomyces hirsutus]
MRVRCPWALGGSGSDGGVSLPERDRPSAKAYALGAGRASAPVTGRHPGPAGIEQDASAGAEARPASHRQATGSPRETLSRRPPCGLEAAPPVCATGSTVAVAVVAAAIAGAWRRARGSPPPGRTERHRQNRVSRAGAGPGRPRRLRTRLRPTSGRATDVLGGRRRGRPPRHGQGVQRAEQGGVAAVEELRAPLAAGTPAATRDGPSEGHRGPAGRARRGQVQRLLGRTRRATRAPSRSRRSSPGAARGGGPRHGRAARLTGPDALGPRTGPTPTGRRTSPPGAGC